jgi:hypothetical protein
VHTGRSAAQEDALFDIAHFVEAWLNCLYVSWSLRIVCKSEQTLAGNHRMVAIHRGVSLFRLRDKHTCDHVALCNNAAH